MLDNLSDFELLTAYRQRGAQEAFAQVVRRHANLVYGTARRQVADPHLAEDVAQAVFLILAQKAGSLSSGTILSGWLYTTTLYTCANAIKSRARRQHHEQKRGLMTLESSGESIDPAAGDPAMPLLDDALAQLRRLDRDAVLLKFIEGKTHRQVGEAIGLSEEAVRKRINRALERLRGFFQKRGVALSAAAVGTLLTNQVAQAAPASVLASTAGGATGAAGLAKGTLTTLAWAQAKIIAASVAATLLIGTGVGVAVHVAHQHSAQAAGRQAVQTPPNTAPVIPAIDPAPAQPPAANKTIDGVVIGTDGEPQLDAEVYLATPQTPVNIYANRQRAQRIITEKDGKFSFPRPSDDWIIVVVHEDGIGTATAEDLAASPRIIIKQWGRIEGTLYAATRPLAKQTVTIGEWGYSGDPVDSCFVRQTTVTTDKDGHFSLLHVPPGAPLLAHQTTQFSFGSSKWNCVEVKPGATVKVDLGAVGVPVIGKVTVPAGWEKKVPIKRDALHQWDIDARLISELPKPGEKPRFIQGMELPRGWNLLTPRQQHFYREKWEHSPMGIAYRRHMFAEQTSLSPDGTFRFDVLKPGRYSLNVRALELNPPQHMLEDVAGAFLDFTVPALPDGKTVSDQPLDIGVIVLKPSDRVAIGERVPFEATSLDRKPVRLDDFKGKILLLHIDPANYPSSDTAGLGKVYEARKNDPHFAMLSIHIGPTIGEVKAKAEKENWAWPQAIGTIKASGMPAGYQAGPSMNFIIGPDGKVIAKVLKSADLDTELAKILLEQQ